MSLGSLADVFSALAGVLLVTSEYRFGTIRPTILFNPERSHVLAAKVVAGAALWGAIGAGLGAISYHQVGGVITLFAITLIGWAGALAAGGIVLSARQDIN